MTRVLRKVQNPPRRDSRHVVDTVDGWTIESPQGTTLSDQGHDNPHLPGPSLWPIGFAIGVACLLLGLVISWIVAAIGAVLAIVFGFLWARDVTRDVRERGSRDRARDARGRRGGCCRHGSYDACTASDVLPLAVPRGIDDRSRRGDRSNRHDSGARLHGPSLVHEPRGGRGRSRPDRQLPRGHLRDRQLPRRIRTAGEVSRRTAFVRNNGPAEGGEPSFTILYSRCVHLGCPVQPNGPIDEAAKKEVNGVELRPVLAQSFGCPCHGGLYDAEGNRQAGPPVRSMDRYTFSIKDGRLVLGELYAVGNVSGTGANASISKYPWSVPGTHVDGVEAWLYPIVPSQVTG